MSRLPRWSRSVAGLLAVATVGLLSATGAGAQEDPYGGTTTTPPDGPAQPTLTLDRDSDVAGARVEAEACGYESGTEGQITFNGANVADTIAGDDGCLTNRGGEGGSALPATDGQVELALGNASLAAAIAEAAAGQEGGSTLSFRVPDLSPGTYLVCSVASGYESPCVEFKVIAERVRGGADGKGRQGLAFTGIEIAVLLALALVLLVVGRTLVQVARRRRRRLGGAQRHHRRSKPREGASV